MGNIWGPRLNKKECQQSGCSVMHPCDTRRKGGEYLQLTASGESQIVSIIRVWAVLSIHHTTWSYSLLCSSVQLSEPPQKKSTKNLSHVGKIWRCLVAERVYSQVSRLSLSICDPERTVSMSIRRSELRPSGMQGISSSPSDIGSTGIDSCRVIEEVSAESPKNIKKRRWTCDGEII